MKKREILVTSALPYANGPLHLGHLLEYIQTDIWVRFQRQCGHQCYYVCADDAHGSPIMLKAKDMGISPEDLIAQFYQQHQADFDQFFISFDNYYSTHSPENQTLANTIYQRLQNNDLVFTREVVQAYDDTENMFLPDRFIKGKCPQCGAEDQYGDCCEACGATYTPSDLLNAKSVLSGESPIERASEHYFFKLKHFESSLKKWLEGQHIQPAIRNKLNEWFDAGLKDWDISRDEPYFGFEIPDHPGKYFYVWLDAPIGYMASFKNLCQKKQIDFDHYWKKDSPAELHHFIGKDIAYFHTLFWPAVLEGAGFRKPSTVRCHGFVTINKQKMSKSRGTFITAADYLKHLSPEYLRYYFAAKLNSGIEDIDLNLDDFVQRVNSDLIGKLINIASRCSRFIHQYHQAEILCGAPVRDHEILKEISAQSPKIMEAYENCEYSQIIRQVMKLADNTNRYIDQHKPWEMAKDNGLHEKIQEVCSVSLIAFTHLTRYLGPILPKLQQKVEALMNVDLNDWYQELFPESRHTIQPFEPLMQRIDTAAVDKVVAASEQTSGLSADQHDKTKLISYADFEKLDLRVACIAAAEEVDGANRLLRLSLDDNESLHTVLAGIKANYTAADLIGRQVVFIKNLKPKKTRFGTSAGMILAAGEPPFLISPDEGAKPGTKVK